MTVDCAACGISIGAGFMEEMPYQVGKYSICGWCYVQMRKRGKIEVRRLPGHFIVYLLPSGEITRLKENLNAKRV